MRTATVASIAALAVIPAAIAGWTTPLAAQSALSLRGSVVRQTLDGTTLVAREQVTLHRVNARDAGPIDSVLTDARGEYGFRVSAPDSQSMYLVSARYGGIAYFSQPMQVGGAVEPAEIVVYDTTSSDVRLQLQGRHFVISSPSAEGIRSVIDVLEIQNDSIVTRVAGASNVATYSLLLPDGARNVRASQGESSDGMVQFRDGRADLFAPLAPGLRQVVLTYELPPDVFPLAIPLERAVGVLEVLLEEPGANAEGGGLVSQGGVSVDGKNLTRFLGQNSPANAVLTLSVPRGALGSGAPPWLLPLVLTLVTLGVILVLARRGPSVVPGGAAGAAGVSSARHRSVSARAPAARHAGADAAIVGVAPAAPVVLDPVQRLVQQVAAVDALLAREGTTNRAADGALESSPARHTLREAARRDLEQYRGTLKSELVTALARRTQVR